MAEMTPWLTSAECSERTGMHLWEDVVYTELVDPETQEPVAEGRAFLSTRTSSGRPSR